jgi:hypothetical protein
MGEDVVRYHDPARLQAKHIEEGRVVILLAVDEHEIERPNLAKVFAGIAKNELNVIGRVEGSERGTRLLLPRQFNFD